MRGWTRREAAASLIVWLSDSCRYLFLTCSFKDSGSHAALLCFHTWISTIRT